MTELKAEAFASCTVTGECSPWRPSLGYIQIPLSSLPGLTPDEVVGPYADIRKVYMALCEAFYRAYTSKPVGDRPIFMTITKTTGEFEDVMTRLYTFDFVTDVYGLEVAVD